MRINLSTVRNNFVTITTSYNTSIREESIMRVDGGSTYYFPAKIFPGAIPGQVRVDDGEKNESAEEDPGESDRCSGITFELTALSLLTQQGEQNPVGAQGWFASAVLSSLLLLDWRHPALKKDLERLVSTNATSSNISCPRTVLEIGSGTISLVGMTLTWILAQHQQDSLAKQQLQVDDTHNAEWKSRVVLTDNNPQCLDQLEINADTVRNGLQRYFNTTTYDTSTLPDLQVKPLDWENHDQTQSVVDVENNGSIDIILGAELVYTSTGAGLCSHQIAKILKQNPRAVLWLAQYPRDGWLHVLKIALERQLSGRLNLESFCPTEIHPNVHALAQKLMPRATGSQFDLKFIKVVRVSLADEDE